MRAPDFWSRQDAAACVASTALLPLGWIYGAVTDWRRTHAQPYRAHAKVVCVGNLTAGGSGKTPVVAAIVRMLLARGLRATILSRGYGGQAQGPVLVNPQMHVAGDVGDEPLLLAARAPVIVARDRPQGAALADTQGVDVIVMDDGYQNFTLAKDLSLIVVDAEKGFGNGRILPAGPLRENIRGGLARADAVVLVGDGTPPLAGYSGPVMRARFVPSDGEALKGGKTIAFAGIGRPEKFFATLRGTGTDLAETYAFADHHVFTAGEIARLKEEARSKKAMLVTTEKDFVRLASAEREGIRAFPIEAVFEQPDRLQSLLDKLTSSLGPAR